jgi:hypothetical protein
VITSIGYVNEEVPINGRALLTVHLTLTAAPWKMLVVVGYGTRKKNRCDRGCVIMNAEKIRAIPTPNITQALQGRIAGIEATQSNFRRVQVARIRIRGNRSLNASNEPLCSEMEFRLLIRLTILTLRKHQQLTYIKDVLLPAIYGVRGANGK